MIARRDVLFGGAAGAVLAGPARARAKADRPFSPERLFADVTHYVGFGEHRTGSPGDRATGAWIQARLRAAGFQVSTLPIDVPFFDTREASIVSGGLRIAGHAQHPVVPTGPGGITAPLHMRYDPADDAALAGRIAVVPLPYGRHSSILSPAIAPTLAAAAKAGAVGIIVITTGPSGLAIALNTTESTPFGALPILNIGIDQAPQLIARARAGESATLVLDGASGRRRGDNIIAHRAGPGRKVVVTTPLSGWFRCAGERGPGVAGWLAFADWLPRAFPHHDLTFAGLVGHEFENAGSKRFMADVAPRPEEVALWQHFGAGLATRDWHEATAGKLTPLPSVDPQRYLLATPALLPVVQRAALGLPGWEHVYRCDAKSAAGEATNILAAGYDRLIANFAGHRFHHTEGDTLDTTSGVLIAPPVRSLQSAASAILRA